MATRNSAAAFQISIGSQFSALAPCPTNRFRCNDTQDLRKLQFEKHARYLVRSHWSYRLYKEINVLSQLLIAECALCAVGRPDALSYGRTLRRRTRVLDVRERVNTVPIDLQLVVA